MDATGGEKYWMDHEGQIEKGRLRADLQGVTELLPMGGFRRR